MNANILEIRTGCVSEHSISSGRHMSIDEQYIGKCKIKKQYGSCLGAGGIGSFTLKNNCRSRRQVRKQLYFS